MSWLSFVLLGLALAMDCFAVSFCLGLREKCLTPRLTLAVPFAFGFFQGLMPLIGWAMGLTIRPLIENFDHWVAFVLLLAVGGTCSKKPLANIKASMATLAPVLPKSQRLAPRLPS